MARDARPRVGCAARAADVVTYSLRVATAKAEETRERILDAALSLFRERGFDETTMRDIAAAAGVATGAAYYYFRSKEELVMAFYVRTAEEAREVIPPLVTRSRDLGKRIRAIIDKQLQQFEEHRRLMVALVRIGIDPKHPLSPFGEETSAMRNASIDFFRAVIVDSKRRGRRISPPICRGCSGCIRWASSSSGCSTNRAASAARARCSTARSTSWRASSSS